MTGSRTRWTLCAGALVAAACGGGSEPTQPTGVYCSAVSPTSLAVGAFTVLDASQTACVRFPAPGGVETEHLYVALATEGRQTTNGITATFDLEGGTGAMASVAPPGGALFDQAPTAATSFHDRLRARERNLSEHPPAEARSRISASLAPTPGRNVGLGFVHAPLEPFQDQLTIVAGLDGTSSMPPAGTTGGDHARLAAAMTGAPSILRAQAALYRLAPIIDHLEALVRAADESKR